MKNFFKIYIWLKKYFLNCFMFVVCYCHFIKLLSKASFFLFFAFLYKSDQLLTVILLGPIIIAFHQISSRFQR